MFGAVKLSCLPVAASVVTYLAILLGSGGAVAAGDPAKGATVFAQCQACHSPEKGVNRVGPSLYAVVGRPAGSIAGYEYSPAMQEASKKGLIWTDSAIVAYLQNPHKYLEEFDKHPGIRNKMPFFVEDAQQRQDVVAYLKTLPVAH